MKLQIILTVLVCGLLVQSCGGDELVGDWFACKDAACSRLDDDGIRFTEQGGFSLLEAPGSSYDPGEAYSVDMVGSYTFDGSTLTVTEAQSGESMPMQARLDGEDLIIYLDTAAADCIAKAGGSGAPKCKSEAPSVEAVRFKRVGYHGCGGPPQGSGPNTTTPVPSPIPSPPDGPGKEPTPVP